MVKNDQLKFVVSKDAIKKSRKVSNGLNKITEFVILNILLRISDKIKVR